MEWSTGKFEKRTETHDKRQVMWYNIGTIKKEKKYDKNT